MTFLKKQGQVGKELFDKNNNIDLFSKEYN